MLVSTQWLKEWVSFYFEIEQLAHRLTMSGLEVDSASKLSQCDENVVIGQVISVKPHPKSDRLSVCRVEVGGADELQIVCGAPNVVAGGKYPVAPVGSKLKNQMIENIDFRSVPSQGMLCSGAELELDDAVDGLMELNPNAPLGISLNTYLQRDDYVLDLELTPNRADCLSIRGVAREIAILEQTSLKQRREPSIPARSDSCIPVDVKSPADCPVFCTRVIENFQSDAVTPDWMKQRLERVGLRSIHPIVDITNYVMIELGQPMHAFDTDVIDASKIIVRHSKAGESLSLLDGERLTLGDGVLMINDHKGPIALAGVMGGEASAIQRSSTNIMLEAAFFSPDAIRRSVSRFGMHTDASHRFERGVDPTGQRAAIERATELIIEIAGGVPGPVQETRFEEHIQKNGHCYVRYARVNRVLGLDISYSEVESILLAVNKSVARCDDDYGWYVISPSWRFDLGEEHDMIEEVARIYGYDKVPSRTQFESGLHRNLSEKSISTQSLGEALHSLGYHEAITYSFVDPALQEKFDSSGNASRLANPIAENLSVMRTSMWPGLVGSFLENYRRSKESIRLYEIGRVFLPDEEVNILGGLCYGNMVPTQWGAQSRQVDFFDLKGDLERLAELSDQAKCMEFKPERIEGLHPWRSAGIYLEGDRIGSAGQLHPDILDEVNSSEAIYVFEIKFEALLSKNLIKYMTISKYPSVIRDISLVIDADQRVSDIESTIRSCGGNDLESATLFDVYCEIDAGNNFKSVAYRLVYRSNYRTLTDSEVDTSIKKILDQLNQKHNANLRV